MDNNWSPVKGKDEFPAKREKRQDKPAREAADFNPSTIKPEPEPARLNKRYLWVGAGIVVLLILLFAVVIPAYKGYSVYKQLKAAGVSESYVADMAGLQGELNNAQSLAAQNAQQRDAANSQLATCQQEKQTVQTSANAQVASIDKSLTQCTTDVNAAKADLKDAQATLASDKQVIADAGRRICCIARFNDPAINAYDVKGDSIVCVKEGGTSITC